MSGFPLLTQLCGGAIRLEKLMEIRDNLSLYNEEVQAEWREFARLGAEMFAPVEPEPLTQTSPSEFDALDSDTRFTEAAALHYVARKQGQG